MNKDKTSIDRNDLIEYHKLLPKFDKLTIYEQECLAAAYAGTGFVVVNRKLKANRHNLYNCYDINSAYQAALLYGTFPLKDMKYIKFEDDTRLEDFMSTMGRLNYTKFIICIKIYGLESKYPDCEIRDVKKSILQYSAKDNSYVAWMCDVDIYNLLYIYSFDYIEVLEAFYFKKAGYYSQELQDYIMDKYEELHSMSKKDPERKKKKLQFHISTYGKNAQIDRKFLATRNKVIRTPYILTAIYQAAYTRRREIELFVKYHNYILYMDTDSVFIKNDVKIPMIDKDKIGYYKEEYKDVLIDVWNIKGYAIYDKKRNLLDAKQSGLKSKLTKNQIEDIINGKVIEVIEDREGRDVKVHIYDKIEYGLFISPNL